MLLIRISVFAAILSLLFFRCLSFAAAAAAAAISLSSIADAADALTVAADRSTVVVAAIDTADPELL